MRQGRPTARQAYAERAKPWRSEAPIRGQRPAPKRSPKSSTGRADTRTAGCRRRACQARTEKASRQAKPSRPAEAIHIGPLRTVSTTKAKSLPEGIYQPLRQTFSQRSPSPADFSDINNVLRRAKLRKAVRLQVVVGPLNVTDNIRKRQQLCRTHVNVVPRRQTPLWQT